MSADNDHRGNHISTGVVRPGIEHENNFTLLPEAGLVEGTVTNALIGTPIIGAAVQILSISPFGPVNKTVVTDGDGNYSFGLISEGTYTITVSKENFGSKSGSFFVENAETSTQNFALIPNPSSVSGVISSDGTPLVDSLVQLFDVTNTIVASVQTDAEGRFLIQNFNPGIYAIVASNTDYQNGKIGFTVEPGQTASVNLNLTALPGVLTGTIVDQQSGTLIQGAVVQLYFGNSVQPVTVAVSDDTGVYVISGLAPGVYNVGITYPNYRTFTTGAVITANDTSEVDGFLVANPGNVRGTVSGTASDLLSGAGLKVVDVNGGLIGSAVTDANGYFSIGNLTQGTFAITVKATDHRSSTQGFSVTPGSTENVFFILLEDPGRISGNVSQSFSSLREIDNEDARQFQIEAAAAPGSNIVGAVVSLSINDILLSSTVTDSDGNYAFEDLAPGTYQLTVNETGFALSSLGAIVFSNGTAIANFILNLLSGSISGTVVDEEGTPISGQSIFINLYDQNNLLVSSVQAQPDGTYLFTDVVPGNYIITVNTSGYNPNSFAVTVNPDDITTLNLELQIQGGTLAGRVINQSTSLPISGVALTIFNETGIPIVFAISDQDGLFTLPNLPAGTVVVSAVATGFSNESRGAIIGNGATTDTVVALSPETGNLLGVITDVNGAGIPAATIFLLDYKRSVVTTVLTQNDGRYAIFNLLPGIYTMIVSAPQFEQKSLSAFIDPNETTVTNVQFSLLPGSVEGVVTDASTGAFISQTNVELRLISASGPVVASALTDSLGQYRFNQVSVGTYTVVTTNRSYGNDSASIIVNPEAVTFADLQLSPLTASVGGTVRNSNGTTPLVNSLLRVANQNGIVIAEIQTDIDGNFFIEGLLPGEYSIVAINTDYRSQVLTINVQPNETGTANFNLAAIPSLFSGVVTDAESGLPIVGAIVETFDLLNRPIAVGLTNNVGFYTITGLSEGTYTLRASAQGYGSDARQSTLGVNDPNVENFALLQNPGSISGTVTIAGNGPLANALVSVYDANGNFVGSASTNREGTYFAGNLRAGQVTLRVDSPGYNEASREVFLERGEQLGGVDFALSPGAEGDVTGQVSDSRTGNPIAGVLIQIFDPSGNLVAETTTNENGVYALFALPADLYTVRTTRAGYLPYSISITVIDGEELLLPITLQAISPSPPNPCEALYYIIIGGKPLTLDSLLSPTEFRLEQTDPDRNCITFSYESVVEGIIIRRFITFDQSCITLIRVLN
jgi:uncharacterized surface anchored protein